MTCMEGNFSKIVRSLLLDIDTYLDQLVQIGYYTVEQRAFLDKYLYKSEDALLAADLARGSRDGHTIESMLPKLTSWQENRARELTPTLSKLELGVDDTASRGLRRIGSAIDTLQVEENGLTNFLKRCNARNFSVQVRGSEVVKESTNKGKIPDFVSTLEPIAEGNLKASESLRTKLHHSNISENIRQDTYVMQNDAESFRCDMDVESLDYEEIITVDVAARISADKIEPAVNYETENVAPTNIETVSIKAVCARPANIEAVSPEPTKIESSNSSDSKGPSNEPTKVETANTKTVTSSLTNFKPIVVEPAATKPLEITSRKVEDIWNEVNSLEPADISLVGNPNSIENDYEADGSTTPPAAETRFFKKVKLNAWGKPVKADPTRNEEGALVGNSAKPLGPENKGRAMMEKMGWSKGTGLGKQMNGILEPISHKVKNTKMGLHTVDEKKPGMSSCSSSENLPKCSLVEAKTHDWNTPGMTVAANNDWDKPVEMTAEQIRDTAVWADAERVRQIEVAKVALKPKAEYHGIKAMFLREGEDSAEKTIKFKTRFLSTNKYKSTKHYPGVVVRALSAQGSEYSKRPDDKDFKVSTGNQLEILRLHSGNDYHVYNFQKKKRGIVKISVVEMMEESEVDLDDEHSLTSVSSIVTS